MAAEQAQYQLRYSIDVDEVVVVGRLSHVTLYRAVTILGLVMIVGGAIMLPVLNDLFNAVWTVVFGVAALLLVRTRGWERFLVRRRLGTIVGSPVTAMLTTQGVSVDSATGRAETGWANLTEIVDDARTVVFWRARIIWLYLPPAAFASPAQRLEVVAFARERLAAAQLAAVRATPGSA